MPTAIQLWFGLLAYLLGSLPFGCWIGFLKGVDLRTQGSGGTGATNAWRALGPILGSVVFVLDAGKGSLATHIGHHYGLLTMTIFGLMAMVGHTKSPFLLFKGGGKAVATLLGVALVINWKVALVAFAFWAITLAFVRYVSLASIMATAYFALVISFCPEFPPEVKLIFTAIAILVLVKHLKNLGRIKMGTEPKVSMPWDKWGQPHPEVVTVGFTVDGGDKGDDADYYRRKLSESKKWKLRLLGFFLRHIPDSWVHKIRAHVPSIKMGSIKGIVSTDEKSGNPEVAIEFRGIPESAKKLKADKKRASRRIMSAIYKFAKDGIELMGLGAFTSIATDNGTLIQSEANVKAKCSITTGNSLTAYSAIAALLILAWLAGKKLAECVLVIVGGGGSIGLVCAKLLARLVGRVILVGHNEPLTSAVQEVGGGNVSWTYDLEWALGQADLIVIACSNDEGIVIDPKCLKYGAIGVSMSRPRFEIEGRDDVLVVAGGIYQLPGELIRQDFDFGLALGEAFACMSEVVALACERMINGNFSIGKVLHPGSVLLIGRLARKHGLVLARFRSTKDVPIPTSRLEKYLLATGHEDPAFPGTLDRETWLRLNRLSGKMAEFNLEAVLESEAA